ncbi:MULTISPECIES: LysE family translocator [unclassified Janthinobacterium]|nr:MULTISPECIES: LysE family transporter [unclassified Janthinobacterium]
MIAGFFLILLVPGPTNTLLLSSGIKFGVARSINLIAAETLGYLTAISAWGFFLLALSHSTPALVVAIKLLCAVYIAYLGWQMWPSHPTAGGVDGKRMTFASMYCVTLLNPKAILFASGIFPLAAFASAGVFFVCVACFVLTLVPVALGWLCLGASLKGGGDAPVKPALLLRCASLVLLLFSATLAYSVLMA